MLFNLRQMLKPNPKGASGSTNDSEHPTEGKTAYSFAHAFVRRLRLVAKWARSHVRGLAALGCIYVALMSALLPWAQINRGIAGEQLVSAVDISTIRARSLELESANLPSELSRDFYTVVKTSSYIGIAVWVLGLASSFASVVLMVAVRTPVMRVLTFLPALSGVVWSICVLILDAKIQGLVSSTPSAASALFGITASGLGPGIGLSLTPFVLICIGSSLFAALLSCDLSQFPLVSVAEIRVRKAQK